MHLVLNPQEARYRDAIVEFYCDLGFISDANAMADKAIAQFKEQKARRIDAALKAQQAVAVENANMQHRSVDGLGQIMRRIAPELRAEISDSFGEDSLKDDKFMDRLDKENGFNFKPNYDRKTTVINDKPISPPPDKADQPSPS